jgi:C4-type Zn-finger protein
MREPTPPTAGPPGEEALPAAVQCPFCEGFETRLVSPFGGQLSVATYWCDRCRTGFDYLKWDDETDDGAEPPPPRAAG